MTKKLGSGYSSIQETKESHIGRPNGTGPDSNLH